MSLAFITHHQHRYLLSSFSSLQTTHRVTCLWAPTTDWRSNMFVGPHHWKHKSSNITANVAQFEQVCNAVEQSRDMRWLQWPTTWTCFALEEGDNKLLRKVGYNLPMNTVIQLTSMLWDTQIIHGNTAYSQFDGLVWNGTLYGVANIFWN